MHTRRGHQTVENLINVAELHVGFLMTMEWAIRDAGSLIVSNSTQQSAYISTQSTLKHMFLVQFHADETSLSKDGLVRSNAKSSCHFCACSTRSLSTIRSYNCPRKAAGSRTYTHLRKCSLPRGFGCKQKRASFSRIRPVKRGRHHM
jgi:hypothetical protein